MAERSLASGRDGVRIAGKRTYLWRTIDDEGEVLDMRCGAGARVGRLYKGRIRPRRAEMQVTIVGRALGRARRGVKIAASARNRIRIFAIRVLPSCA